MGLLPFASAMAIKKLAEKGQPNPAEIEAARLGAKVKRFRADNYPKHGRLPNAVG